MRGHQSVVQETSDYAQTTFTTGTPLFLDSFSYTTAMLLPCQARCSEARKRLDVVYILLLASVKVRYQLEVHQGIHWQYRTLECITLGKLLWENLPFYCESVIKAASRVMHHSIVDI